MSESLTLKERHQPLDMTVGSPLRLILRFSLPLLLGNLFQQAYNMVDSIVVGNFVGKSALAAVGTSFSVMFTLVALFYGLGVGAMVLISQFVGAADREKLQRTVDTVYTLVLVASVPLTLLGIALSGPMLQLIHVPADVMPEAKLYLFVIFIGMFATLGYNINAGILRGLGDSRSPLIFLVIATGINIVLDLLFVAVFHWGVAGVAVATIIAQAISWVYGIVFINRRYELIKIRFRGIRCDREILRQMLRVGVPVGVQQALFSIGIMALQSIVNVNGGTFMAGYNAAGKLDSLVGMIIQSFGGAATAFVGQNIGAGRYDRLHKGVITAVGCSVGISLIMGVAIPLTGPYALALFNSDPGVISAGMAYLSRVMPVFFLLAVMNTLNAVMQGAGEVLWPMVAELSSLWIIRLPAANYLLAHYGPENIFWCYGLGWVLGASISVIYYLSGRWRRHRLV